MFTWLRYRDEEGNQFDLREDALVPGNASRVKDYPIHHGPWGRDSKPAVKKGTTKAPDESSDTGAKTTNDAGATGKESE